MTKTDLLRSMLRALTDVKEQGDAFEMSDLWEVTVHAGRKGAPLTIPHVVKMSLKGEFVVVETSKGHRFVVVDEDVSAIGQEPSERETKGGRRAGFM